MAMLAEPRQRKRYNLVPRGKALYDDDSRYGTKMLEKMGWSKGKGLGANETGSQDFVRIKYKNDVQGLGFEDRDDQWKQHEEEFNGLLNALNGKSDDGAEKGEAVVENASDDERPTMGFGFAPEPTKKKEKLKEKFSGESLEEKSKKSKARVHYKKFTRGKDLAQYSEKDLANIFGKKALDQEENQLELVPKENSEKEIVEEESKENFAGVQMISTGLSVSDYFKQKMEAMKNRKLNGMTQDESAGAAPTKKRSREDEHIEQIDGANDEDIDEPQKKKKKKKRSEEKPEAEVKDAVVAKEVEVESKKKKKKSKKEDEEVTHAPAADEEIPVKTKKCKKRKIEKDQAALQSEIIQTSDEVVEEHKKSKKNKKVKKEPVVESLEEESPQEVTAPKKLKKKKSKEVENNPEDADPRETVANGDNVEIASKKAKKKKHSKVDPDEQSVVATLSEHTESSSVSAKKPKNEVSSNDIDRLAPNDSDSDSDKDSADEEIHQNKRVESALSLDEIKSQLEKCNVFEISSFCAEKFRNVIIEKFQGSNLSEIVGYSFDDKMELKIETLPGDEERITQLWSCKLNKYSLHEPYDYMYKKYVKGFIDSRKNKEKRPRFYVKSWKRKNAFKLF